MSLLRYSRGTIDIHTTLDLRGGIPTFIFITDDKYHDSNVLNEIVPQPDAIYVMFNAYINIASLYRMNEADEFFVTRAKVTMDYLVFENNFIPDETTGLRSDRTIKLKNLKSKQLHPDTLRIV
jgi:hypothetical protein